MKIVRESKSGVSQNTPQNENCHRVQIQGVPEYSPQNENCQRVQIWRCPRILPPYEKWKIQGVILPQMKSPNLRCPRIPPKIKIVRESKSKVSQNDENCHRIKIVIESKSENENCQNTNPRRSRIPPKMKIVIESKSKVSQNTQNSPPQWKLSESPNLRCPRIPPNENCHRVQIQCVQNNPPKWKLS